LVSRGVGVGVGFDIHLNGHGGGLDSGLCFEIRVYFVELRDTDETSDLNKYPSRLSRWLSLRWKCKIVSLETAKNNRLKDLCLSSHFQRVWRV
jgi:hypothetical protein